MTENMRVDMGGGRERTVPVNYPSNSIKSKENPGEKESVGPPVKKVEKVITGTAVRRKKSLGGKLMDSFVGESGVEGMIDILVTDILVAAFKAMVSDAVSQASSAFSSGIDQFLYGEERRSRAGRSGYVSYNKVRPRQAPEYRQMSRAGKSRHAFDEMILPTRGEAEDVRNRLLDLIDEFGMATVADFYEFCGMAANFTDDKWGWTDLRTAVIRHVRGGFLISIPRPQPLD